MENKENQKDIQNIIEQEDAETFKKIIVRKIIKTMKFLKKRA